MTATKGEGAAPAVPHPGDFEEWLDNQRQRQDRTGAVARFVIEDLERGCWPDPTDLFIWYKRTDEEQRQAWVNHLVGKHRMPPRSIEIFCEVHAEYLGACRRWFEWNQAMNAGQPFDIAHGEDRDASDIFWQRIREAQGKPTK